MGDGEIYVCRLADPPPVVGIDFDQRRRQQPENDLVHEIERRVHTPKEAVKVRQSENCVLYFQKARTAKPYPAVTS